MGRKTVAILDGIRYALCEDGIQAWKQPNEDGWIPEVDWVERSADEIICDDCGCELEQTYEQACSAAAEAQGLKPYMDVLTAMGREFDLWQTGGFQMVLAIPTATANRAKQSGIFVTIGSDLICVSHVSDEQEEWICALCVFTAETIVSLHLACDHSWDLFEDAAEVFEQLHPMIIAAETAAAQIGAAQ